MESKVSIIVPVYNNTEYLRQCFDSILTQTYKNIEVIVIDDGSTDEEASRICDEYAGTFRVFHQKNHGVGYTFNRGISLATGQFIGQIDADDYIEPNMYEVLMSHMTDDIDVVKAQWNTVTRGEQTEYPLWSSNLIGRTFRARELNFQDKYAFICSAPSLWSGVYRKTFLDCYGIRELETEGALYQDTSFTLKCRLLGKYKCIPDHLYNYRIDNPNQSTRQQIDVYALMDEMDCVELFMKEWSITGMWEILTRIKMSEYEWAFATYTNEQKEKVLPDVMENMRTDVISPNLFTASEMKFFEQFR